MLDLTQPPYRATVDLLHALRDDPDLRPLVAYDEAHEPRRGTHDRNQPERLRLAHILQVAAVADDVGLVRFALDEEITARQRDSFQGCGDALRILSLLLLEHGGGDLEDTWRFWRAKTANFDTFAGGYDIEFVVAQTDPEAVVQLVTERDPGKLGALQRYDLAQVRQDVEAWRTRLRARHYPRSLAAFTNPHARVWAEDFGDDAALEGLLMAEATTAEDRARAFQQLGKHGEALLAWREAAAAATTAWDRAARLRDAMQSAAKGPVATLAEAEELDGLRSQIDNWHGLGLGRQCTQACHELAAAVDDPQVGPRLWRMAERWRSDLVSYTLVGLQAGVAAAKRWGTASERADLERAAHAEHVRIHGS
jgi:cytochrome c2